MKVRFRILSTVLVAALGGLLPGCINQPQMLPASRQKPIDRAIVETPPGTLLVPLVRGLNSPQAFCFDDTNGALLLSESGVDGCEPHIFGYRPDHSYFQIYPWKRTVSFAPTGFVIYGPITGMVAYQGKIYAAHRDREGKGVITAFGYDGSHTTIIADLPCQGDYGIGDLVVNRNGRLFFGVGTATNSGVVGLDNFDEGWAKKHPDVHDKMYTFGNDGEIILRGYHFFTPNPWAGLFGGSDLAVTGPGQKFGTSILSRLRTDPSDKPSGAIYSVSTNGGDPRIEAIGLHHPRGLVFDEYTRARLYAINDGMELRGTRPVYGDPDALLRISTGAFYGWPDFSTTGNPISDAVYRPPVSMIIQSGYPELQALIDAELSGLQVAKFDVALHGVFPSLSGAAKMAFVPASGPFKDLRGNLVVALDGDRWPFATSGIKLQNRVGFKVVIVDPDGKQPKDFIRNTAGVPASMLPWGTLALERPCDVKFAPNGDLYILDFGRMDNNSAIPRYYRGSGTLFKLTAVPGPATMP